MHSAEYTADLQVIHPDLHTNCPRQWPDKYNVLGVAVTATTVERAADIIISSAQHGDSALVTGLAVHGLVLASNDEPFKAKINRFDLVTLDGQPI